MINNLIFDVGGVILLFNKIKLTEFDDAFKDNPKYADQLLHRYFIHSVLSSPLYANYDKGEITLETLIDDICLKTGEPKNLIKELFNEKKLNSINTKLLELIKKYKRQGKHIFILSNMGKERVPYIREFLDESLFDDIVFSSEIGLVKPNVDIFEYVCNKWGIKPNECLFIDDNKNNTDTFQKLGGNVYLFNRDDIDKSIQDIERIVQ